MLRDEIVRRFPRLKPLPADSSYVVGGAIRDLTIGVEPADVDVACLDPLACARAISDRVIRLGTGDHMSAWRVVDGEHVYDFSEILDHDIAADLARRDFTINAMAVPLGGGELLDPHGGRADLERGLVRMIAPENLDDDPLRCLKAVRMAVTRGFEIDPATIAAIHPRAPQITRIAAERVTYELSVIFSALAFRRAVGLLHATGLDVPLFGRELDASGFHADDVSLAGAFALLAAKPKAYAKLWRWSAELLREVTALQSLLGMTGDLRVALYDAGENVARQLPAVLRALGGDGNVAMPDFNTRALLSGDEIGKEGPEVGRIKRALLETQIRCDIRTREEAVEFVERSRM
jgi:Poly A polymerase head domain/Probable RNA and SrmB- binding site of polymerase A